MSHCLPPRPPSLMTLRDEATPEDKVEATIMCLSAPMFPQTGKQGPREGEPLAKSHTANLIMEPEPCLPPCPVICVLSCSLLTPRPNTRTQKQLLETGSLDPCAVQEEAGLEGTRQDIKLTAPLEWPWH